MGNRRIGFGWGALRPVLELGRAGILRNFLVLSITIDVGMTAQITVTWYRTQGTDEWLNTSDLTTPTRTCDLWAAGGVLENEYYTVTGGGIGGGK